MLKLSSTFLYLGFILLTRAQDFDLDLGFNFEEQFYNYTYGPFSSWKTEPLLESTIAEVIKGRHHDTSTVPLCYYIFSLATFDLDGKTWGLQIFDNELNLVYMSPESNQFNFQDPHVCDYQGQKGNHICTAVLIGELSQGKGETEKLVYNSSYVQVGKFGQANELSFPNFHEFNMLEGGESFLQVVYEPREVDLTPYGGRMRGSVYDACFQEISTRTTKPTFQWCYLDHSDVWETYIFPAGNKINLTSDAAGKGLSESPWDFLHINAVDKNFEGDYIITARHLDQILKIAGNNNPHGVDPGTVLWKMGGKQSDFRMKNDTAFSRPHQARFIETTFTETTISLFDNSWEGNNEPLRNASAGRILKINNSTKEVHLIQDYVHPESVLSRAAGSMQVLDNNNDAFVGWGWIPDITEFDDSGTVLFHAKLSQSKRVFNYRAYKTSWIGRPLWPPKIVAYSRSCKRSKGLPLVAYVSWNGATEVKKYRFHVRSRHGIWISAGTFDKQGFETEVNLMQSRALQHLSFVRSVSVEALDSVGKVLGSASTETFVPSGGWADKNCDMKGCFDPPRFNYSMEYYHADTCDDSILPAHLAFILVFALIEGFVYLYHSIIHAAANTHFSSKGFRNKSRKYY